VLASYSGRGLLRKAGANRREERPAPAFGKVAVSGPDNLRSIPKYQLPVREMQRAPRPVLNPGLGLRRCSLGGLRLLRQ